MKSIGRNDLCPCGSGKKYKRCCLENDRETNRKNDPKIITPEKLETAGYKDSRNEFERFQENNFNYDDFILTDDDTMQGFIDMRIYPKDDFDVTNTEIDFPCIVYDLIPGHYFEPSHEAAMDNVVFYIYSEKTKKECYQIYNRVKSLIKNHYHYDSNYNLNITGSGRARVETDYNPNREKDYYYLTVSYDVMSVEQA